MVFLRLSKEEKLSEYYVKLGYDFYLLHTSQFIIHDHPSIRRYGVWLQRRSLSSPNKRINIRNPVENTDHSVQSIVVYKFVLV
jgi:hypothetical protein